MRHINKIIIHHSGTEDNGHNDWENIRRYHTSYVWNDREVSGEIYNSNKENGVRPKGYCRTPWKDIGYHYGVEEVDGLHLLQIGRDISEPGAHCRAENSDSIGFLLVGDFDNSFPSPTMMGWAAKYLAELIVQHKWYDADIEPHRKYCKNSQGFWKSCPGKNFDMNSFVYEVRRFQRYAYNERMRELDV